MAMNLFKLRRRKLTTWLLTKVLGCLIGVGLALLGPAALDGIFQHCSGGLDPGEQGHLRARGPEIGIDIDRKSGIGNDNDIGNDIGSVRLPRNHLTT